MDSYLKALEEYNAKFERTMQAFDDYLTEAELAELQSIGQQVQEDADLKCILDEVERVHGIAVDRETISSNLRSVK